jgi:hypothetical protein
VDPRASLDEEERRESSWPYRGSNCDPSGIQPVAIPTTLLRLHFFAKEVQKPSKHERKYLTGVYLIKCCYLL